MQIRSRGYRCSLGGTFVPAVSHLRDVEDDTSGDLSLLEPLKDRVDRSERHQIDIVSDFAFAAIASVSAAGGKDNAFP